MRLYLNIFLAVFTFFAGLAAAAAQPQKSVLISWSSDTPDHVIDAAKNAILEAGGVITHEYRLIKGIAATGAAKIFDYVGTLSTEYPARIEDDQIVTINKGS